ncbi:MAG: amino acid adenylation domain-containing protein, partial [Chloroflexi bacterium]|nr:amino acid adenylation domain-containing protein [Chloroflexota bacterium]
MQTGERFSCVMIGKGGLLLECGELLLERDHTITAIVSNNPKVREWAATRQITCVDTIHELPPGAQLADVDYLFSIANGTILREEQLQQPRRGAINYHNGPLPRYAGVHATSWAILSQERSHGVTWHRMTAKVDAGDILKQEIFPLDARETTLTLNLKCYDRALAAFGELIDELATGTIKPIRQDLSQRSYFGGYQKWPGGGLIDWSAPADAIDRLCRALDFGSYPNALGAAKFVLGQSFCMPRDLRVLDTRSDQQPGTIVAANERRLQIATATHDVAFAEVRLPSGQIITAGELIAQAGLDVGTRLPLPSAELLDRLTEAVEATARHESFWIGQLKAANPATLPLLPLETGVTTPAHAASQQALSAPLDAPLHRRLQARFGRQSGLPALLSAWLIYLYRHHNEAALSVRFSDERIRAVAAGLEPLIARDVPLNLALSAELRFADVQRLVEAQIGQLHEHLSYLHDLTLRFPALSTDPKTIPITLVVTSQPARFKPSAEAGLTIAVAEDGSQTRLILRSATIDPATHAELHAIGERIQALLSAVVADPDQPISRLPLLTARERQQLAAWNDTAVRFPNAQPAPQIFEEQARRTPDAIAMSFADQTLSYRELNARANQLAHVLIERGVAQGAPDETFVGVALDRSPELLISLLAIHKAGGVYVPLDPAHPEERIRFMLADTQAPIVLTRTDLRDRLGDYTGQVIALDREWTTIAQASSANPSVTIEPSSLAYVMYTSGSTGQPKGVLCTHDGLTNRLLWSLHTYRIGAADSMVQIAAIGFDISVWEMLFPLLAGARLVIAEPERHKDAEYLVELLASERVTSAHFVPSLLDLFLDHPEVTRCTTLRQVVCGGEALSVELKRKFFRTFPAAELHHAYGPTEAAISVTHWNCRDRAHPDHVPLGRPIANTQIHILDQHGEPVPIGVTGELHIGGVPLARGYLNRPDLTATAFIADPFDPNARLYRTGDLGRWLPDGNLEFLGRRDSQLKIRGFRVELGEIEAVLIEHPQVRQAIVIARDDQGAGKRLVAYVVEEPRTKNLEPNEEQTNKRTNEQSTENTPPSPAAAGEGRRGDEGLASNLRTFLTTRLPEYMVPSGFVVLDRFPLTPNGKVDRAALLKLNYNQRLVGNEYVVPETALERRLAGVWSELLGVQEVGTLDNFFTLGGHSLLASRLISWIRQHAQVDLPLRAIFAYPTIQSLAQHITATRQQQGLSDVPTIEPSERSDHNPLSFAQERLWFLDKLLPPLGLYNSPIALHLRGALDVAALERAFARLLSRHEILRSSIREIDGRAALVIAEELLFTLRTEQLPELPTSGAALPDHPAVRALMEAEASQPFDLTQPPLIRTTLLRQRADEHLLLVTTHHIVSDGWSAEILFRDLSAFYNAEIHGATANLPELPIQYLDVAAWQRRWLRGSALEKQLNFWQQELHDLPEQTALPTSKPRPAELSYRGAIYRQQLPQALRDKLLAVAESCEATSFMALVAAFQTLLHRYSGQDEIAIGTPFANRHQAETANLIGLFVNTVVLRASYADDPSFVELLRRVRATTVNAYEHQDCPFEKVVERVHGSRDLNRQPLFQTMLVLNNSWQLGDNLRGLKVERVTIDRRASMFDLTLEAHQHADGLLLEWEYSTDLFDARYVERLAGQFITLLEGIVANPETRVGQLPLLSAAEQHQLLIDWNRTQMPPNAPTIQQLFEAQVARTPEAIALVAGERRLSYRELNAQANQLAHHLRTLGIAPDRQVALSLDRSPELIVGLLGVLKAGGAYVPLDPRLPKARLRFMLADTKAPVLITQSSLAERFGEYGGQIVLIDRDWTAIAAQPERNPAPHTRPEDLAYVIYTSGSTGQAKGVLIEQRSLVNYTAWSSRCFEFSA